MQVSEFQRPQNNLGPAVDLTFPKPVSSGLPSVASTGNLRHPRLRNPGAGHNQEALLLRTENRARDHHRIFSPPSEQFPLLAAPNAIENGLFLAWLSG